MTGSVNNVIKRWKGAVEPAQTGWTVDTYAINLCNDAQDFSAWTNTGVTVNANTDAYNGDTIADTLTDPDASYRSIVTDIIYNGPLGATFTVGIRVKKDAVPASTRFPLFRGQFTGGTLANIDAYIDTSTGDTNFLTGASGTCVTDPDDGDYWLLTVTYTDDAAKGNDDFRFYIFPAAGANADLQTLSAAATGSIVAANCQINRGSTLAPFTEIESGDLDPPTAGIRTRTEGAVTKETVTNLCLRSEDFSTSWALNQMLAFGAGSTVDAAAAPNGTHTADLLVPNTTSSNSHYVRQNVTSGSSNGDAVTGSVYVEDAGYDTVTLRLLFTDAGLATFDLTAGTTDQPSYSTITDVGNGRYRITITGTRNSASAPWFYVYPGGQATFAGDGTSGVYLWGAQFVVGDSAGTYVKTTTATKTQTFGGNKIYLYKGAVQPTEAPTCTLVCS